MRRLVPGPVRPGVVLMASGCYDVEADPSGARREAGPAF